MILVFFAIDIIGVASSIKHPAAPLFAISTLPKVAYIDLRRNPFKMRDPIPGRD